MKNIKLDTIIRTVLLAAALINQALTSSGHAILPFDDQLLTELVTVAFTLVTAVLAWWKNNSFSKNAQKADTYLQELNQTEQQP